MDLPVLWTSSTVQYYSTVYYYCSNFDIKELKQRLKKVYNL